MKLDTERDVSEKIALGIVDDLNSEANQFDERLFNQSEGLLAALVQRMSTTCTKRLFKKTWWGWIRICQVRSRR